MDQEDLRGAPKFKVCPIPLDMPEKLTIILENLDWVTETYYQIGPFAILVIFSPFL